MEQKYLPIGSVCTLKGKNKKIMITGYYSVEFNGNLRIKDYCGCVYPEGMLLPEQNCIFNHSDIESIDFVGYKNETFQTFKNLLNRLTGEETTQVEQAAQFHKENDMFLTSNSTYSKLLFDENGVVMIADRVIEEKNSDENKKWKDIQFNEDGTVIKAEKREEVKNPFYKDFSLENKEENEKTEDNNWNIFNKIEFDENGVVVDTQVKEQEKSTLNKIEFDENGIVISVNGQTLVEENNDYTQYKFDENGVLVADGENRIEDHIPAVGPGLPGYEEPKVESKYKFDENGNVISE